MLWEICGLLTKLWNSHSGSGSDYYEFEGNCSNEDLYEMVLDFPDETFNKNNNSQNRNHIYQLELSDKLYLDQMIQWHTSLRQVKQWIWSTELSLLSTGMGSELQLTLCLWQNKWEQGLTL